MNSLLLVFAVVSASSVMADHHMEGDMGDIAKTVMAVGMQVTIINSLHIFCVKM